MKDFRAILENLFALARNFQRQIFNNALKISLCNILLKLEYG